MKVRDMSMTEKEYFDFVGSVLENMSIPVAETITEENTGKNVKESVQMICQDWKKVY